MFLISYFKLSITNTRSISTKAVATKITRAMKAAQNNRALMEAKIKTTATETIKAKTQQAATTLKLPKEHFWWSYWLLNNSFKSLVKGYNIWLNNMSQYRLFRWLRVVVFYILWPIEKAIQILAYFRIIRMFLLVLAFILGLFTDVKEVKNFLNDTTGLLVLNLDSLLGFTIFKLQDLAEWFKDYFLDNHVTNKQAMEKALPSPINYIVEDEGSWISNHKWEIFIGLTVGVVVIGWIWIYCNTGNTPPVDPSSSEIVSNVNTTSTYNSILNYVNTTRGDISDLFKAVQEGNFSGIVEPSTSTKLAEVKNAAEASIKLGENKFSSLSDVAITDSSSKVDTNLLNDKGISKISGISPTEVPLPSSPTSSDVSTIMPNSPSQETLSTLNEVTGSSTPENLASQLPTPENSPNSIRTLTKTITTPIYSDRVVEIDSSNCHQFKPWGREDLRNKLSLLLRNEGAVIYT